MLRPAIDVSLIRASVYRQRWVPDEQDLQIEASVRAASDYFDVLDDAAFGSAAPVTPKRFEDIGAQCAALWHARGGFPLLLTIYLIERTQAM